MSDAPVELAAPSTARENADGQVDAQMRRLTRRSFGWGAAAAVTGFGGWKWLRSREEIDGVPRPLRRMLEFNERVARSYYSPSRLAPSFPLDQARMPRANGQIGLETALDLGTWQLQVESAATQPRQLTLTLDDVEALPRVEMVTELKCIEGWSDPVHWTGARLVDFADKYGVATRSGGTASAPRTADDLFKYVSMETPDRGYYVGLDIESALHPQTLLCYEMNGEPLAPEHGAPLRLATPLKYGIKHIKRIGKIVFTDQRPADYWAEQGYDWYAGH
jgi:DMSO/TMAO reductase YedYZ molybdopterin-dependent catalytic subunit